MRASGYTFRSTDIGVVLDLMIHDLDLLLALVASPVVKRVRPWAWRCSAGTRTWPRPGWNSHNGCVANLSASRVSYNASAEAADANLERARLRGRSISAIAAPRWCRPSEAVVHARIRLRTTDCRDERASVQGTAVQRACCQSNRSTVEHATHWPTSCAISSTAFAARAQPRVTGEHGRDAVAVAEAVLESIETHRWHGTAARTHGARWPCLCQPILRGPHWRTAVAAAVRDRAGVAATVA